MDKCDLKASYQSEMVMILLQPWLSYFLSEDSRLGFGQEQWKTTNAIGNNFLHLRNYHWLDNGQCGKQTYYGLATCIDLINQYLMNHYLNKKDSELKIILINALINQYFIDYIKSIGQTAHQNSFKQKSCPSLRAGCSRRKSCLWRINSCLQGAKKTLNSPPRISQGASSRNLLDFNRKLCAPLAFK